MKNHKLAQDEKDCLGKTFSKPSCTCTGITTHSLGCPCYKIKENHCTGCTEKSWDLPEGRTHQMGTIEHPNTHTEAKTLNNEPVSKELQDKIEKEWQTGLKDLWFRSHGQTPHFLEVLKSFIVTQKELSYNEGYAKAVRLHEEKEKKAFEEGYKVGHDKCSEDEGN